MTGQLQGRRTASDPTEVGSGHRSLRRATIDFSFDGNVLHGHVAVEGSSPVAFSGVGELQRCLGLGQGYLLLVDGGAETEPEGTLSLATLKDTERRIIEAAVRGASNREIAETTFYSVKSIEAYLTRIYRRFGINGRSELSQVIDLAPPECSAEQVVGGAAASATSTSRPLAVQLLVV